MTERCSPDSVQTETPLDGAEKMPQKRKHCVLAGRILLGLLVVAFSLGVASLGGFLNHCRGGYVHFGPRNGSQKVEAAWYWPQHTLGRLLFALPTGLVVIVFGLHVRGSLVVSIMTWFSLYVGWGSYMNIGMDNNYCMREGTFDWLLGRQPYGWSNGSHIHERFVREYSGMSLRGLLWTLPQGYVLEQMGFGWEYSLTGSAMPLIYYIGANTNTTHVHGHHMKKLVGGTIAVSELMWGMWVWFVLIMASLSQGVRRARVWIYKRQPYLGFKPFSRFEVVMYKSMNRPILRGFYDGLVITLTVVYVISTMFYSLVRQKDLRNKGQTFFGLFTSVLFLVFTQAWLWALRYRTFLRKRHARQLRGRTRTNNAIYDGGGSSNGVGAGGGGGSGGEVGAKDSPELPYSLSREELAHYEGLSNAASSLTPSSSPRRSRGPVLSWPYSHPDRLSPTEEQRQQVLETSEHIYSVGSSRPIVLWVWLEKFVCTDVFIFARRTIGVVSLICTIFSMMMTLTAMIIGWNNTRFSQDLDPPCPPI